MSVILRVLWSWIAVGHHLASFARISPAAYGSAMISAAGAIVFIWQGVIERSLALRWVPGLKSMTGLVRVAFALVVYLVWSANPGHPYPETPTFGLPRRGTIFTIGLLCFAVPPTPRSVLIVPVLWCGVGVQAAFLLGVQADLGLIAAGVVGVALLLPWGRPLRTQTS